jgi:hypothetical protein
LSGVASIVKMVSFPCMVIHPFPLEAAVDPQTAPPRANIRPAPASGNPGTRPVCVDNIYLRFSSIICVKDAAARSGRVATRTARKAWLPSETGRYAA